MKLHDALRDATHDTALNVEHLITQARRRGSQQQRRRRVVQGTGIAASIAMLAAVGYPSIRGENTTTPEAGPAASTSVAPAAERRQLASRDVVADRLKGMLNGTVTEVKIQPSTYERPGLHISLLLNGAAVTAMVNDASPKDPATVPAPGQKPSGCAELPLEDSTVNDLQQMTERIESDPAFAACVRWTQAKRQYDCAQDDSCWAKLQWGDNPCKNEASVREQCTRLPDGGWAWQGSQPTYGPKGPDQPTDLRESFGRVYAADYWEIQLSAYNSANEKESPALFEQTVLSPSQLASIASSNIWFE